MAKRFIRNKRNFKRKKRGYTPNELTRFAYMSGVVDRGLKNENSKVYSAYQSGLVKKEHEGKKPLL